MSVGADGVGELVLNRPHRKNALSPSLVALLAEGLETLIHDESVRAILIRGNGPPPSSDQPGAQWLCSGVDLKEQRRLRATTGSDGGQAEAWARFHAAMYACPKMTVGVLEGGAIAGGTGLAFACDVLIAGEHARFHVAEVNFGMAAPFNVVWCQLKHGSALALEMIAGGQPYSGQQLVQKGVAVRCVADADVLAAARDYAAKIAANDGGAMAMVKDMIKAVRGGGRETFEEVVAACLAANAGTATRGFPTSVKAARRQAPKM
eukprot:COSAG01_NODE_5703_length_4087_cov_14.995737_3_plen_263_part_00